MEEHDYKEERVDFDMEVEFLETQVKKSYQSPLAPTQFFVPLEIHYHLCQTRHFYDTDRDGTLTLVLTSDTHQTAAEATINDVRRFETDQQSIRTHLLWLLSLLEVHPDHPLDAVEKIISAGLRLRKEDPNIGAPKVLRLKVVITQDHIWIRRRPTVDALIRKSLKRVRVAAAEEEKEEGGGERERKGKRGGGESGDVVVASESEICPICMVEFVEGSEDVNSMPCSHVFHAQCIATWLTRDSRNCPICRFEIPTGGTTKVRVRSSYDGDDISWLF